MSLDLCHTFLELGDAVSRKLERAYRSHISYGEETITESSLLEIWHRHAAIVNIQTFSKPKEAMDGADWEWRLIGRKYTLKMRVQAKRFAKNSFQIKGLLSQKAKTALYPQIDALIADATMQGMLPVYCIYSAENARSTWTAANMPARYEAGCLLGLAEVIRSRGIGYLSSIEQDSVPWHFLVCPCSDSKSRFPSLTVLNGDDADSATACWTSKPYIVPTEGSDRPGESRKEDVRRSPDLPEDYKPAPVIGRVLIDCRRIE